MIDIIMASKKSIDNAIPRKLSLINHSAKGDSIRLKKRLYHWYSMVVISHSYIQK